MYRIKTIIVVMRKLKNMVSERIEKAGINESIKRPENEATRMTNVGRNDLR